VIARNINLREALNLAARLGFRVEEAKGTGEIVVSHPQYGHTRVNRRKKNTPAKLVTALRRAAGETKTPPGMTYGPGWKQRLGQNGGAA
jgi:hypothetical protein